MKNLNKKKNSNSLKELPTANDNLTGLRTVVLIFKKTIVLNNANEEI